MNLDFDFLNLHLHTRLTLDLILSAAGILAAKTMYWFGHYLVLKWSYKKFDGFMDKYVVPHFRRHPKTSKAAAIHAHHKQRHKAPNPFVCNEGDCIKLPY